MSSVYCPLVFLQSWAVRDGQGFQGGQCDCRVAAIAFAVALTTVTGSPAAGSTAGMSLGTLCMGGTLGPSRVSKIPKGERWRMSENWLGRPPGQLIQPTPPHRPLLPLTLYHLVVGKMQIEQKEHVQSSQCATKEQPLGGAYSP